MTPKTDRPKRVKLEIYLDPDEMDRVQDAQLRLEDAGMDVSMSAVGRMLLLKGLAADRDGGV